MATDIFIVTYAPDAVWLEYCLRSIDKFARNFRQTVVAYPAVDESALGPVCARHPRVVQKRFQHTEDGHLDQLVQKSCADQLTDADFILHTDSDCLFTETFSPLDFVTDGKPDLWYDEYENLTQMHPGGVPWQLITENALGFPTPVDTMRRFPILYPRWLYAATRKVIEDRHGVTFDLYVRSAPKLGRSPYGFCEFNALGCVAFYRFPDRFAKRHMRTYHEKPTRLKQFWSHWLRTNPAKFRAEIVPELEEITRNYDAQTTAA